MENFLIFCGANKGNHPKYAALATEIGKQLAKSGKTILYGGGSVGLMGVLADAALSENGKVIGVITEQLDKMEVGHHGITEMILVPDMQIRKVRMLEMCDVSIAIPGGYGTLDEIFEALTLSQLDVIRKPVGILNFENFFTPLLQQIDLMVEAGFIHPSNKSLFVVADDFDSLLDKLASWTFNP